MPSERSTKAPEKNERSRQSSKKSNGNSKKMTKSIGADGKIPDDLQRKIATYQLSCTKFGPENYQRYHSMRTMSQTSLLFHEADEKSGLAEHLRSIAPFNRRWKVTETINEGTYGVVFAVRDVETGIRGVIKVAKSVGNDAGNHAAEWEGFILEKIYKNNPNASIVRLLDKGMLADQHGARMEFMVLEKAEVGITEWLSKFSGLNRKLAVTQAMLQMLKGIYDMHREGLLHRDLKPDNMGILSTSQPYVVLFDLGMTKMYTDENGKCRSPRSKCAFRGTPEWCSGWAAKGREQNRFDDLIAWLYVACELYDPSPVVSQPLPWTFRQSEQIINFLKTAYCPANILLRRAPRQFYEINAYLMTANRDTAPRYKFIADKTMGAVKELQAAIDQDRSEDMVGSTITEKKPETEPIKSEIQSKKKSNEIEFIEKCLKV